MQVDRSFIKFIIIKMQVPDNKVRKVMREQMIQPWNNSWLAVFKVVANFGRLPTVNRTGLIKWTGIPSLDIEGNTAEL